MKKTSYKKIVNWTGILSLGLTTLGVPLLFIGGAGQEVSQSMITGQVSSVGNPWADKTPEDASADEDRIAAQRELDAITLEINKNYDIVKNSITNSGFFKTKSLSKEINTAIDNISSQLFIIADKNKLPEPPTPGMNYVLNTSLFQIADQLKLIVRIDPIDKIYTNILQKNINDNTDLAIAGSILFAIGGIGMISAFALYMYSKKNV